MICSNFSIVNAKSFVYNTIASQLTVMKGGFFYVVDGGSPGEFDLEI